MDPSLSHNPEWVGLTIGAGLSPETEDQGAGGGAEHRVSYIYHI